MSNTVDPTPAALAGLQPAFRARALAFINVLREAGIPAVITSGRRTVAHNVEVGGAVDSRHLSGTAFDLGFWGYRNADLPGALWLALGQYAEQEFGFRWGGRFSTYDPGHFDQG